MKKDVMRAIREKCIDCCAGQPYEVKLCTIADCSLYPYRFGRDPWPTTARMQKYLENQLPGEAKTEENISEASYTTESICSVNPSHA